MKGKFTRKNLKNFGSLALSSTFFVSTLLNPNMVRSEGRGNADTKIPSTTKVLDRTTLQYVSSISEDGSVLIFKKTTLMLESLMPGDVIVGGVSDTTPYGLAPRRVTAVIEKGEQIVIKTISATLGDTIEKGTIRMRKALTPSDIEK